jgi:hypothetical protein
MTNLMNAHPSAIVKEFGYTIFYFDVKPSHVRRLPPYSEFNLVYSPSDVQGWESLRYRVSHDKKGYCVVDRQPLMPDEIAYFESLLADVETAKA